MKIKQAGLSIAVLLLSASSFFLPGYLLEKQERRLIGTVFVTENTYHQAQALLANNAASLPEITDPVLLAQMITTGEQKTATTIPANEPNAATVIQNVKAEIDLFIELDILPKGEYTPIDVPTPILYSSKAYGETLVWRYDMENGNGDKISLSYHSGTGKIVSLNYQGQVINQTLLRLSRFATYWTGENILIPITPPYQCTSSAGLLFSYEYSADHFMLKFIFR